MRNVSAGVSALFAFLCFAPAQLFAEGGAEGLSIGNYQLMSEQRVTRTNWYFTYKADLINTGAARSAMVASLSSLAPNVQVVAGQGTLHFASVPANGRVTSTDTFTILVDQSGPFDLNSLKWTFVNPVANPGPDQTVPLGAFVNLNGSGSTNPSGTGTLSYSWAFASKPAGSAAALANAKTASASFSVDVAGVYIVNLTVDNGSAQDTRSVKVSTVNSKPVAYAGAGQSVAVGATVQLDGTASSDVDGDPLSYVWTYVSVPAGSNALSAGIGSFRSARAFFVADVAGTFIVQLVVNDGKTDSDSSTVVITAGSGAANTPPVANAGANQTGVNVGANVQLSGAGSTDVNGDPLTYKWTLSAVPSGSVAQLNNPNIVNPVFVADKAGTYIVQLIVNDGKIDSAPSTVTITTGAAPVNAPTANAGANQSVPVGSVVTLNGSGTDPQNLALTYSWSFMARPANSTAVLSNTTVAKPAFTADKPGDFVLQLIVNNGSLSSAPSTVTISTSNTPPVANAGANQNVSVGAVVNLNGAGSTDANSDPLTYSWSLITRPDGSNASLSAANSATPTFVADVAGVYVAQLIVNDGFVSSSPATVTITSGIADIIVPASLLVAPGQIVPYNVKLAQPAASDITINLKSSNMAIAELASASVTIRQGQTEPLRHVLLTGAANGSAVITATSPNRAPASTNVTVAQGTITLAISNPAIYLWTTQTLTVTLSKPAPVGGTPVTLSFNQKYLEISPNVVVVPHGATQAAATVRGVQVGNPAIGATSPTFAPAAPVTVNVGASIAWAQQNNTISMKTRDPHALLTLFATVPGSTKFDPADAIVAEITSSNPAVAAPQHDSFLFLWDGSTAPSLKIFFFAYSPGTTIIKAKGVNIPEVSMTLTVVP